MKVLVSLRRELPSNPNFFEGVGLLKSEHSEMTSHISDEKELRNIEDYVRKICQLYTPKPVWYRTNDGSSQFINRLKNNDGEYKEKNPHFGLRGIRRILLHPETFIKEIKMIEKVRLDYKNLNIFFPMVNDVAQYIDASKIARESGYTGRLGIMAETPSAVLTLDEFVKAGVDYVVFGMNDLTDALDGVSRKNTETTPLIYRDVKNLTALKKLLNEVTFHKNVEWVLSGDITPEIVDILKHYPFDSFAMPYYQLGKEFTRKDLEKIRTYQIQE